MEKPRSSPLADALFGHAGRRTCALYLHDAERGTLSHSLDFQGRPIPGSEPVELRGGLLRRDPESKPKPEPEPAPEPPPATDAPDPADQELVALRARQAEIADIRRAVDQHGRDLRWLTTFGTTAPRLEP